MAKLTSKYFSSSGSWTAPAGVTRIYVLAHGGGSGGSGGRNAVGDQALPGGGTTPYLVPLTVVPNTAYTVTIGTGGTGGAARTTSTQNGGIGVSTTFGALWSFRGAYQPINASLTAGPFPNGRLLDVGHTLPPLPTATYMTSGFAQAIMQASANSGSYLGGFSGAPGYSGSVPGTGGTANNAGTGAAGTSATGFGAGGAGGGAGSSGGGAGGAGAPGQLWIIWVE